MGVVIEVVGRARVAVVRWRRRGVRVKDACFEARVRVWATDVMVKKCVGVCLCVVLFIGVGRVVYDGIPSRRKIEGKARGMLG